MKLAIVILNWNAVNDTIRCVKRLSDWQAVQPRVWVVDNASQDKSVEIMLQEIPDVALICNDRNLGFSGGTNRGIRAAMRQTELPILVMNNDADIDEENMARMLQTLASDPSIGVVGPLLYDTREPERLIAAGNRNPVLYHHNLITQVPPGKEVFSVDYVSGSVALFKPGVFYTIGLLDEAYFFNTEIADLCRRARQNGYRCVVDTRAKAYHDLNRSSQLRGTLYLYYLIRNRFIFIRKFYRFLRLPLGAFWAVYSLLLALKLRWNGNPAASTAVYLGLKDGLLGRHGGQNARVLAACKIGL